MHTRQDASSSSARRTLTRLPPTHTLQNPRHCGKTMSTRRPTHGFEKGLRPLPRTPRTHATRTTHTTLHAPTPHATNTTRRARQASRLPRTSFPQVQAGGVAVLKDGVLLRPVRNQHSAPARAWYVLLWMSRFSRARAHTRSCRGARHLSVSRASRRASSTVGSAGSSGELRGEGGGRASARRKSAARVHTPASRRFPFPTPRRSVPARESPQRAVHGGHVREVPLVWRPWRRGARGGSGGEKVVRRVRSGAGHGARGERRERHAQDAHRVLRFCRRRLSGSRCRWTVCSAHGRARVHILITCTHARSGTHVPHTRPAPTVCRPTLRGRSTTDEGGT